MDKADQSYESLESYCLRQRPVVERLVEYCDDSSLIALGKVDESLHKPLMEFERYREIREIWLLNENYDQITNWNRARKDREWAREDIRIAAVSLLGAINLLALIIITAGLFIDIGPNDDAKWFKFSAITFAIANVLYLSIWTGYASYKVGKMRKFSAQYENANDEILRTRAEVVQLLLDKPQLLKQRRVTIHNFFQDNWPDWHYHKYHMQNWAPIPIEAVQQAALDELR